MVRGFGLALLCAALLPSGLMAFSSGPPLFSVGIARHQGGATTCLRCHTGSALNSPGGSLKVEAVNYKPGQKQTIRVTVSHPEALRWGFQLSARRASDLTQKAGSFEVNPSIRVRCAPAGNDATAAAPCGADQVEFAEHAVAATTTGANGTKVFEVEWTPPATDAGDVVFYASGNAANNNGNNQGDRIYNNADAPLRISADVCTTGPRPVVSGIRNAASGSSAVSINTLISIFGSGFGAVTTRQSATPDVRAGFPRDLACVAVEVNGAKVPLTFVNATQINAQVPTSAASGTASYRVLVNGVASDQGTLTIANYAPSLFTFNGRLAAAVAPDGTYISDPALVTVAGTRPARPGEVVQLYATGLGATEPVWQAGEIPNAVARLRETLTVTIGGTTLTAADVLYAGLVPGQISGLYQINARVPASLADGEAPVSISIGGSASPAGSVLPVKRN